jgi:hypothetical protein
MVIMNFQLVAILGQQRRPILALGNGGRLVERWTRLLIRQQKRRLLDIIAIGQPIIPQDVAAAERLCREDRSVS